MKLRILDDSIRLRLDREEVESLARGKKIACTTRFPAGPSFCYELTTHAGGAAAEFGNQGITVTLSTDIVNSWASDETAVSIRESMALPQGELRILVEKDFECLDPREGESQSNRFPNPKKAV